MKKFMAIMTSVLFIAIGFLSCAIIFGVMHSKDAKQYEVIQKMTELIEKSDENNKRLLEELEHKGNIIAEYEDAIANDSVAFSTVKEELENSRKAAGTTELKGKGIIVTIDDSKNQTLGAANNSLVIHDEDLLLFVNELNSAGAEAVSINGQRITARSSIKCAGSIINVNGVRVAAPFEIKAIGDPQVLESALKFKGGVVDNLTPWGFKVDIIKVESLTIESYNQGITYKYAE